MSTHFLSDIYGMHKIGFLSWWAVAKLEKTKVLGQCGSNSEPVIERYIFMPNVPFIQRKDNFFLIRRVLVHRLTMDYIYLGLAC